jgi:hypothetical protein
MVESEIKVGVTGHQNRAGIDWDWVRSSIKNEIRQSLKKCIGYSCLATGTDQIFADEILKNGGTHHAIIPLKNYENFFQLGAKEEYLRLLAKSKMEQLDGPQQDTNLAFYKAGQYIVDNVELLIAVWDENSAADFGGTADIVTYAAIKKVSMVQFNPLTQTRKVCGYP